MLPRLVEQFLELKLNILSQGRCIDLTETIEELRKILLKAAYHQAFTMRERAALLKMNRTTYCEYWKRLKEIEGHPFLRYRLGRVNCRKPR